MRYLSTFIILLTLALFFTPMAVHAVQITLSNLPATISTDSFTLTASVSGALAGTNYLRVDLYKDGTSNFFGETLVGSNWYGGADALSYMPITLQSGIAWSGQVQARIGTPSLTAYDGLGNYKLRVRRYTSSGNYNSDEANASAVTITILVPTVTPTPMPTDEPTRTPTPTRTPIPTPTKNPEPTDTSVPATSTPVPPTKISTPTKKVSLPTQADVSLAEEEVLADEITPDMISPTVSTPNSHPSVSANQDMLAPLLIMAGGVLFIACAILAIYTKHKAEL